MSIRRRLISAVCLVSLGVPAADGQDKNPFADWDRVQKQTEMSAAPVKQGGTPTPRPRSQVTWFSPSDGTRPAEASAESGTFVPAPPVLRERLKTRREKAAPETPTATRSPKSQVAVETPSSPASTTAESAAVRSDADAVAPSAFQVSPVEEVSAEKKIVRAAFETNASEGSSVTQVSAESRGNSNASGNPFAELLRASETQAAAPAPGETAQPAPRPLNAVDATVPASGDFSPAATASVGGLADAAAAEDNGPQAPGVTVEWVRRGELNVGQPGVVELVVHNTSKSTVRSVMAEAAIPANVEVVSADPAPMASGTAPGWTFGELRAGEKRTVTLQVIPRQRGELRLGAFVRLTGHTSSAFAVQEPMIDIAVSGPENAEVGQQVSYVVRVENPGTGVASNVLIQAVIPEGLEHRRGSLLTIEIGTLNSGESRTAQLNLTAVKGGAHQMAVRVLADGGLTDQTLASVSIQEPRLNLVISGPADQLSGRTETYDLRVTNDGSVPSANVRAKYRVPEGFTFVKADRGGKYNETDRSIEWFVGTVPPGESSAFQVSLKAEATGSLLHQAGVISEHGRVTMAEHATVVEGTAALDLQIAANRTQLKVGDEAAYEIRVLNTGSKAAVDVGLSCELPAGLELIQAAGPSDHIAEHGVMVFKSLPSIEAGKSAVFAVKVRCTREGNHRLRLRVASESINEPLIGEEFSRVSAR